MRKFFFMKKVIIILLGLAFRHRENYNKNMKIKNVS